MRQGGALQEEHTWEIDTSTARGVHVSKIQANDAASSVTNPERSLALCMQGRQVVPRNP